MQPCGVAVMITFMRTIIKGKPALRRLAGDRGGNFAIMTAITLPFALVSVGLAVDLSNLMTSKSQLQNAADSAALAAASAMVNKGLSKADAILLVENFIKGQMANDAGNSGSDYNAPTIQTTITETTGADGAKSYRVAVSAGQTIKLSEFMALVNRKTTQVAVSGEAFASQEIKSNPLSMYLVLDRSGSMGEDTDTVNSDTPTKTVYYDCSYMSGNRYIQKTCSKEATNYILKIDALKTAVVNLTGQLATADPNSQYVRTGVATFSSSLQKSTDLEWGTSKVRSTSSAMTASGGTNSTAAFAAAYNKLSASTENTAHQQKNGGTPTKFIVFMTDGDNNDTSYDTDTKKYCDDARKAGIQVYTIGFMVNTTRATNLLTYCATTVANYMPAKNAAELNENFKSIGQKATAGMTRLTN